MPPMRARVPSACQRCRRQKLKVGPALLAQASLTHQGQCDVQKPCALCSRAGVECVEGRCNIWRPLRRVRHQRRGRHNETLTEPASTRIDGQPDVSVVPPTDPQPVAANIQPLDRVSDVPASSVAGEAAAATTWNSSSTMTLIEEAFRYHDPNRRPDLGTTAFSAGRTRRSDPLGPDSRTHAAGGLNGRLAAGRRQQRIATSLGLSRAAIAELASLLPPPEPATLLMDTYFDRVHWFMLLFHQDDFRTSFRQLYRSENEPPAPTSLAFLSTAMAVCAVGAQYVGSYRTELLRGFDVDPAVLKDQMLEVFGRRLLEILALGSLEAVQTCVLLGTYYLYHGEPDLAWPICGCGLRIAQAINLHREVDAASMPSAESIDASRRPKEARKRCWWAIYEIETFCSMLYGLPLSISDSDCDIGFLDPFARSTNMELPETASSTTASKATLLSYKPMMSRLSVIIRAVLTDLYRIRPRASVSDTVSNETTNLARLVETVHDLDKRLHLWHDRLPLELKLYSPGHSSIDIYSDDELERSIGAAGPRFDALVFRLQAVALELAFENTRILIHRPLLTHRMTISSSPDQVESASSPIADSCQISAQTCRHAALQTSRLGSLPVFQQACSTYAVAFVGMHLFTAGVALCIMASLDPMSRDAHESKHGLRRLMQMQSYVRRGSDLPDQGLDILKKLTALMLEKELKIMLEPPGSLNPVAIHTEASSGESTSQANEISLTGGARPRAGTREGRGSPFLGEPNPRPESREDSSIVQAIHGFDPVATQAAFDQLDADSGTTFQPVDQLSDFGFMEQEQGWIWGFDFFQSSM